MPTSANPNDSDVAKFINEAARHLSISTATFLAICAYVGISAIGVRDEDILVGIRLNLPLLNIPVDLIFFYVLSPAIILVFHVAVLIQALGLAERIRFLPWPSRLTYGQRQELGLHAPIQAYVRRGTLVGALLSGVVLSLYVFIPIVVLAATQISFLRYHGWRITTYHQTVLLLDLIAIAYFYPAIRSADGEWRGWWRGGLPITISKIIATLALGAAYGLLLWLASVPERGLGAALEPRPEWPVVARFIPRNLVLTERVLVSSAPPSSILPVRVPWPGTPKEFADEKVVRGLDLAGRDLRYADFTGSWLINADFRGAELSHSSFRRGNLLGAKFYPAHFEDGPFLQDRGKEKRTRISRLPDKGKRTVAVHVNFMDATLEGVNFIRADLTGATMMGARLAGAELTGAEMGGVDFRYADLTLADLSHARIGGSSFDSATLLGATFSYSELQGGARFVDARAQFAAFIDTKIEGATFSGADLTGADFSYATISGATFLRSNLTASRGLRLDANDLRGAVLNGISSCGFLEAGLRGRVPVLPGLVDFRGSSFAARPVAWPRYERTFRELDVGLMNEAMDRLDKAKKQLSDRGECFYSEIRGRRMTQVNWLYPHDRVAQFEGWPETTLSEGEFYGSLGRHMAEACNGGKNPGLVEALLKRALGQLGPGSLETEMEIARALLRHCDLPPEEEHAIRERIRADREQWDGLS